ncbi:MAG: FecR domain-containing protein [Fermentimonas sp.]|nr:FecR domain-containing protein [Fermentimonas sp.]
MSNIEKIELFERYIKGQTTSDEDRYIDKLIEEDSDIQNILDEEIAAVSGEISTHTREQLLKKINSGIKGTTTEIYSEEALAAQNRSKKLSLTSRLLRWTAILLLPLISSIITYYIVTTGANYQNSPVTFSTGHGEKADITLPDGSHVWLNSGTSVTYNSSFNQKERVLNLSGEAYFEVSEDPKRPFIVKTSDIAVEALGTSFNVTAYEEDMFSSSILIDGSIKVRAEGQQRILNENHRATYYRESNILATDAVTASDYILWKDGYLYFDNCSFEDIAKRLSRMFNVKIEFKSDKLRPIRFTGTLGNSSIKNVLDILSLTSPMYYKMSGTTVELYYNEI